MKNIYLYLSAVFFILFAGLATTGCGDDKDEAGSEGLSIRVFSPIKVVEGQVVDITGTGFNSVSAVVFPGNISVTTIDKVSDNMIRVITPAGISAQGGELIVQAGGESVTSRIPLILGDPKIATMVPSDEAGIGRELVISGTDMEFYDKAIFPGEKGDIVVSGIDLERRSTSLLRVKVPKGIKDGPTRIRLVTVSGKGDLLPEINLIAQDDSGEKFIETTVWEGDFDLNGWGNNFEIQKAWFNTEEVTVQVGDVVRLCFKQYNAWNQFKFNYGNWNELFLPEIDGGSTVTVNFLGGMDVTEFEFKISDDLKSWFAPGNGSAIIINGEGVRFTAIVVVQKG
ncbi:hypothetical protein FACS189411_13730 [Bacteroidia bacterium]|nr:hypothetical protein FACS189411_13730 [Bacteroidia bacterium]